MLWQARLNPFSHAWLSTKLVLLALYIALGSYALKRAKTAKGQITSLILALVCISFMIAVALSKQAFVWF